MSYDTDMQRVVKQAEVQGFRVRETTRGHWQFYAPNGKDIIVASGTSCNHVGWNRFMSDMKRAGYSEAVTSIGDAIKEAMGVTPSEPALINMNTPIPHTKLTTREILLDAIRQHPEGVDTPQLVSVLKSLRPDLGPAVVSVTLSSMASKGEIERRSRGRYHPKQETKPMEQVNGHAQPVVEVSPTPAPVDEVQVTSDIEELEAALVALSRIETVVRRNREVLKKFLELRTALNGLNLKG